MPSVTGLLLAALGAGIASAPTAPAVVERVVALVRPPGAAEARVVTLTRVEEEVRIALVSSGATLAASQALDAPALRAGLEWLIDQILLGEEAARLQVFEIDQSEVRAEMARFAARFEGGEDYRAFLGRYDITEEELASVLRRTLRVRRYVESRLARTRLSPPPARPDAGGREGLSPEPHGQGRGDAFHAGRAPGPEVASSAGAGRLDLPGDGGGAWTAQRARALGERFRGEVKALVRDLRARSEVRRIYDFGTSETGAEPTKRDQEG